MIDALPPLLVALHGLGAMLGAGGALFAEIFYLKATADGELDRRERDWFRSTLFALRWGMGTVLVTGLLLLFIQYFLPDSPHEPVHPALWSQNFLALAILGFAYALARRWVQWPLGASAVFAGWWMIFILDVWRGPSYPFIALAFVYAVLVTAAMALWGYLGSLARVRALRRIARRSHPHGIRHER